MKNISKKRHIAFTLAEVLITLAIIGVVSAITIPTVITNHRKTMYTTQVKKTYSNINQAFKKMMADDGVYRLSDTTFWTLLEHARTVGGEEEEEEGGGSAQNYASVAEAIVRENNDILKEEFEKTFKVLKFFGQGEITDMPNGTITYKTLSNGACSITSLPVCSLPAAMVLADGTFIDIFVYRPYIVNEEIKTRTKLWRMLGELMIDTNGTKNPNQVGRDMFIFLIGDDGNLYPYGGEDYAITMDAAAGKNSPYYWNATGGVNNAIKCDTNTGHMGLGCAARIMEEGWHMNY